jgi:hypothetical protein
MKLSTTVEQQMLASLVQGRNILDPETLAYIKPEYFQVEAYQWLVNQLIARQWAPIDAGYLDQMLLLVRDEQKREQYKLQLSQLYALPLTFEADAKTSFTAYLAFCVANAAIVLASENFKKSQRVDYWLDGIREGVDSAIATLQGKNLKAVDYAGDALKRLDNRKNRRDNPSFAPRILTGIPGLDLQFNIRGPIIVNFLAPFKRYKSIFLNALGFSALLQGFNVLHVTLENTYELTASRYDSLFTLITHDRIENLFLVQDELDKIRDMFGWMQQWTNRLKILKGLANATTCHDIKVELERLKRVEGFIPDIIIVDYLNILSPIRENNKQKEYQAQTDIVWNLKALADVYGCPIITASQATREAATEERVRVDQQGKAVGISQAVDLTIAIDQTPEEKAGGFIVLSPQFFRAGPITIPEIILDSDLSRMLVSRSLPQLWEHALKVNPYI